MINVRSGIVAWAVVVGAGTACGQTQCPQDMAGVRMNYFQMREIGFSYTLMTDDPTGRIESLSTQWSGAINGQAVSGGSGCGPVPECAYACRGDGDLVAEEWDFGVALDANPPSSLWGTAIYGFSGLPSYSEANCVGSTGSVDVGPYVASSSGSSTHATAHNRSGTAVPYCWGQCGDPYYVDHGSASTVTKEEHMIVIGGAPVDGDIQLAVQVGGNAGYGHYEAVTWFLWGGGFDCTCIGTPAPLSAATKATVDINVYKLLRDGQGNAYPGSLIQSHSHSGNISSSPYEFTELSGMFAEPDGFTIASKHHEISACDQGNGDEPYAEAWGGKGAAHALIELDLEIKDPCIIIISYYNECSAN